MTQHSLYKALNVIANIVQYHSLGLYNITPWANLVE